MKRGFVYGVICSSLVWGAVLLLPILIPESVARALHSYLDISTPPERADYILVPSGSMFYRLPFAVNLLHQRLGDTLVLTVTEPSQWKREAKKSYGVDLTEGSTVLQLLRAEGVGETEVIFLGQSRSTRQDVKLFAEFLAKHPGGAAAALSDGCHLRRLRLAFEHTTPAPGRKISYVASSNFEDLLSRGTEPSDVYQFIFKEWIKYIFYTIGRA